MSIVVFILFLIYTVMLQITTKKRLFPTLLRLFLNVILCW